MNDASGAVRTRHRRRAGRRRARAAAWLLLGIAATGWSCPWGAGPSSDSLSRADAVGQMLMVGFRGDRMDDHVAALLADIRPGGIVLFDYDVDSRGREVRNITSPGQLRALIAELQAGAPVPYFIAIDVEGGLVNRLKARYGFALEVPSAEAMGAQSPGDTRQVAAALAAELAGLGINWNFAPVVDVNVDPDSPAIGALGRSFSDDPATVAAHAQAFIAAHLERGIIPALKHFPGHGSAAGDTHLGVTDVTETYRADLELAPYRQLIADGYDHPIMTAHIVNRRLDASGRPGTLSSAVMTRLLREDLAFDGVVISDDMQMAAIVAQYGLAEAAVEAVRAGVDIVMLANQQGGYDVAEVYEVRDALLQAVAGGQLTDQRICESVDRIRALKERHSIHRATG